MRTLKIAFFLAAATLATDAAAAGVAAHPIDKPGLAPYSALYPQGRAIRGVAYRGPDGADRAVVLGGNYGPPALDDKGMNALHVYGVARPAGGAPQVQWEIKEASGPLCVVEPLVDLLKVEDPLASGDPVVLVPYWLGCDGLDPTNVKLIVYYQDRKYAIRGTLPYADSDDAGTPTRTASDNFRELPTALQKYLWDYWTGVEKEAAAGKDAPTE